MAFTSKTWIDRLAEFPNRRRLDSAGIADTYDVMRSEGNVTTEGDKFDAPTMNDLEERIAAGFEDTVSAEDLAAHKADTVAHMTQAQKDTLASAIQSATLGGTAVPKSGTTLQFPAYPTSLPANGGNAATLNGRGTDNGPRSVVLSGRKTGTTIGNNSNALGYGTTASAGDAIAEGYNTTASAPASHAEGQSTIASNEFSHAEGYVTQASGFASHAEGQNTTANVFASHAGGLLNKDLTGPVNGFNGQADAMVVGNGYFDSNNNSYKSNCFRITFDGKVYGLSDFNSSGADYAEYFEWLDENLNKEDRVGHFVALDGEKIKYANDGDYIVGIVSGAPAIVGDHPSESWSERWKKDVFGRIQYHTVDVPDRTETRINPDGTTETVVVQKAHQEIQPVVNPDYDPTKEADYQNREKRPEWDTVGMLGKIVCIDDGTCVVNGYCKPKDGIATKADIGYRVIARLDATHVKVLFK